MRPGFVTIRAVIGSLADSVVVAVIAKPHDQNREIAYINEHIGGDLDLWLVNENGTGTRQVSTIGHNLDSFSWSRDGSLLAMSYQEFAPGFVEVFNVNQNVRAQFYRPYFDVEISPDNRKVVFRRFSIFETYEIWTMNIDGTEEQLLTKHGSFPFQPHWSPDGRRVAFLIVTGSPVPSEDDLWIINADGSDEHEVVRLARNVSWSPDGKYLLYDNGDRVWIVKPDGGPPQPLTSSVGNVQPGLDPQAGWAHWSADGQSIVYITNVLIRIVTLDGHVTHEVIGNSASYADLSPDGTKMVFLKNTVPGSFLDVTVSNLDGSGQRPVTGGIQPSLPRWRP